MRSVSAFEMTSLDGYFVDAAGDMSWAHRDDAEWRAFSEGNASGDGALLFGRVTYRLMAGFWPTPAAAKAMPATAAKMNAAEKIVFSRSLVRTDWNNTRLFSGDLAGAVRTLKQEAGAPIVILGSGAIVAQLTEAGLIDEYQIVTVPIVLGAGRTLFEGVTRRVGLSLLESQRFTNGNVFSRYAAAV
ncbi:MAG: dihydrofolate reductase family protein [Hyphomonadaceae bacterium]